MHGYSLLRPELNKEYFHALYDNCKAFDIPIEGVSSLFAHSRPPLPRDTDGASS